MSSRSLSSFFAACDDFRQSFGRGQELAEKRIIKLQTELSELEKAMWKESCIKLTRGPKKNILNHIKPNEVVISCLHICLILFDYVCRLLIAIGGLSFMLSISGKDVF